MAVSLSGSSTTGTLNAPGVGSGLDVKSLVSQLMAVEQRPLTVLASKEAAYQSKLTGLGSIKGVLSALQSAAVALASASTDQYSAAVGDTSVLTASAGSSSSAGSYKLSVSKLAQAQKLIAKGTTSTTTAIGSGSDTTVTFTFGNAEGAFIPDPAKTPVSLIIGSANNTLAGIRDAINAANAGVTASIVNDGGSDVPGSPYRLAITSNVTGVDNSVKISTSGDADVGLLLGYDPDAAQPMAQSQAAQNAELSIDDVAITSASNTVAEAIEGVTLNLKKIHANPLTESTAVTVQRDNGSLISALGALVKGYNDANKTIAGATAKSAVFQGDSGVLGMQIQVRSILGGAQETGSAYTMLSQLGISFQKDGSLALDSAKLNVALAADPDAVSALTAAVGNAIDTAATSLLGASGPIASKTDGINRSIKDIGSSRTHLQQRLDAVQKRYQQQFSALDTLISSMNKTSAFLTQQLANLPNLNDKG